MKTKLSTILMNNYIISDEKPPQRRITSAREDVNPNEEEVLREFIDPR